MTQTRKWSLLAALLVAAIFVASWFLVIGPKRSDAAALRQENEAAASANGALQQKLEVLEAQSQELPAQQARLAHIRRNIPDNPALPPLVRDLTAAARKAGVSINSLQPQTPVALVTAPVVAVVPSAAPSPSASEASGEGAATAEGAAPAPVAAPAPPASTLLQVPLTVVVKGSYFELEQFVNKLEGLQRSFLVTGFTLTAGAAGDDLEADTTAPLELTLQGRVFMSPAQVAAATAPQPTTTAPAAPAASAE